MGQENFHASVQYNDYTGTAAADFSDNHKLDEYLEKNGLIRADEFLVGVQLWSGEVHKSTQDGKVSITAIVANSSGYDNLKEKVESEVPLHVRKIHFYLYLNEFFGFFKRFEICISNHGIIDNLDITYSDD